MIDCSDVLGGRLKSRLKSTADAIIGLTYVFPRQVSIHKVFGTGDLVCRKKSDRFNETT